MVGAFLYVYVPFSLLKNFIFLLENVNPDLENSPQEIKVWWVARLNFSISLEISIPGGIVNFSQSLGPQGK